MHSKSSGTRAARVRKDLLVPGMQFFSFFKLYIDNHPRRISYFSERTGNNTFVTVSVCGGGNPYLEMSVGCIYLGAIYLGEK